MKDVLGLIVTGGDGLLAELGVPEDAALTPFAGKYRFIDFALATLVNSDVASIHVASPRRRSALRTHLAAAALALRHIRNDARQIGARARADLDQVTRAARHHEHKS